MLTHCQALIERLSVEEDAVGLLQRMLGYASSGIATAEVMRLAEDLGGSSSQRHLVALNALYPLMLQLPLALWPDGRVRQEALHFFLVVMDELTRTERGPAGIAGGLRNLA
ncbi:TyeA family type III secretion system gatekeeper subunit [Pseudomonas costantinii]|uniref:TyeA family type III secretion system gatekeeper subunit n=1 Tax=Pseudomonas costantinii TaxID=168469 RepID=UPI003F750AB6